MPAANPKKVLKTPTNTQAPIGKFRYQLGVLFFNNSFIQTIKLAIPINNKTNTSPVDAYVESTNIVLIGPDNMSINSIAYKTKMKNPLAKGAGKNKFINAKPTQVAINKLMKEYIFGLNML